MYHLTPDQYDAFFLAAANLCMNAKDREEALTYVDWLSAYTAILTGKYPERSVFEEAIEMAKDLYGFNRENADVIIKHFIGEFTYDPAKAWRISTISKAEIEELGGNY